MGPCRLLPHVCSPIRRWISRNSVSAASPRRRCSSGVSGSRSGGMIRALCRRMVRMAAGAGAPLALPRAACLVALPRSSRMQGYDASSQPPPSPQLGGGSFSRRPPPAPRAPPASASRAGVCSGRRCGRWHLSVRRGSDKQRHLEISADHARAIDVRGKPAVLFDGSADTGDASLPAYLRGDPLERPRLWVVA